MQLQCGEKLASILDKAVHVNLVCRKEGTSRQDSKPCSSPGVRSLWQEQSELAKLCTALSSAPQSPVECTASMCMKLGVAR